MKIACISDLWLPFPGGAERYVANVSQALIDRGHEVHVLTSYAPAKDVHCTTMTIEDIGVNERHGEGWTLILKYLRELKPDLLITHHFFAGQFPALFNMPFPAVELIHNRQRNENAAIAVFNSHFTAIRCGIQQQDMVILPPAGASVLTAPPYLYRDCIGHIKPLGGKGIELTYKLARIMSERKFLVLRGEWQDGEQIERLPNVEFMEPCDDIRDFYSRCRVVLMPSLSEDAGTVPQECALNGIPCVSSNVGGLQETNFGGVVLPPDDVYPWITEICALDHPMRYAQIVEQQRLYIRKLDWPKQFDELDQKVRALCSTTR